MWHALLGRNQGRLVGHAHRTARPLQIFFEQLSSYLGRECRRPGRAGDAQELRSRLYLPCSIEPFFGRGEGGHPAKEAARFTSLYFGPASSDSAPKKLERSLRPAGWTRPIWPLLLATRIVAVSWLSQSGSLPALHSTGVGMKAATQLMRNARQISIVPSGKLPGTLLLSLRGRAINLRSAHTYTGQPRQEAVAPPVFDDPIRAQQEAGGRSRYASNSL